MLLSQTENYRISAGFWLGLLVLIILVGCSDPSKERVSQDFKQLFAKEVGADVQPIIASVGPGEGDSENVYEHIKFDVLANKDVTIKKGWLAGVTLKKGQKLYGGEVVILYQKSDDSEWVITRYDVKRSPSQRR